MALENFGLFGPSSCKAKVKLLSWTFLCVCVCFHVFFIIQIQNNQKSQDIDSNNKKLQVNQYKITKQNKTKKKQ